MNFLAKYFRFVILYFFFSFLKKRELLDGATVSDQEVRNDDVVYMVFARETGTGFEELQADTLVSFGGDEGETNP